MTIIYLKQIQLGEKQLNLEDYPNRAVSDRPILTFMVSADTDSVYWKYQPRPKEVSY